MPHGKKIKILRRLGTFFILIGLILLVLYAGSTLTRDVKTNYLLAGVVTFLAGLLMRGKKPPADSGRFSALRRASSASRQRREEKMNQRTKK